MAEKSVKEYAREHGVTIQAVYQQMNRKKNKEFLQGHIFKRDGVKYLDEEAVEYLERQRIHTPSIIMQTEDKERVEQLENENKRLLLKIAELQDELLKERTEVKQLQQEKIAFLEQKQENQKAEQKGFWSRLFKKGEGE